MRRVSPYEIRLRSWLENPLHGIPTPKLEHPFGKEDGRRWRIDFAWPELKVGVEVDGGGRMVRWQRNPRTGHNQPVAVGRHGSAADYEKLNYAAEKGWRILRFNPDMLKNPPEVLSTIRRTLAAAHWYGRAPAPEVLATIRRELDAARAADRSPAGVPDE